MTFIQDIRQNLQSLDAIPFGLICGFIMLGCAAAWVHWFKKTKRARLIEDVPTSTVRSAAQGYLELIGNADFLPDGKIISPLSGRSCVWYQYQVEKRERNNDGKRESWKTIEKVTSEHLFILEDDTGRCVIDPDFAEVTSYENQTWYGNTRVPGFAPSTTGFLDSVNADYRYKESWIEPAEMIYAIGQFETAGTGEELPSLKDEMRTLLNKWKQYPDTYLRAFDKNGDGKIDQEEWADVRKAASAQVHKDRLSGAALPDVYYMHKPPQKNNIYILSSFNADELVKKYRNSGRWLLIASIALGATAVWMLNIRL